MTTVSVLKIWTTSEDAEHGIFLHKQKWREHNKLDLSIINHKKIQIHAWHLQAFTIPYENE